MTKTIQEINEKIKEGKAVVVTAEEIIGLAKEKGIGKAAREVDVVTTGTFGTMCSSGAYFNIGHSKPRIKLGGGRTYLNDVPAYAGFAAIDLFLGANALPDDDPRNRIHPGEFNYGGGHVIEELVDGKDVRLSATAYGTDCYPRRKLETWINIKDLNQAVLFNIRNAYQNYNVAANTSDKTIYTYLGMLKPRLGNANFATAGQLSPLFNDPYYRTIGIGTKIFLGGGTGYIAWEGTQHNPDVPRTDKGIPKSGAGTFATIGDLKQMSPRWLVGTSVLGYGCSLGVGIGVPIPILSEEILQYTTITDDDIFAPVIDYSDAYPQRKPDILTEVSYAELKSGQITIQNKKVPTASLSSYSRAVEIATILKEWVQSGNFLLTEPVAPLPGVESGVTFKPLNERPVEE
ncbi:homocysteine biosynthesis protein [Chloroflexota bacterium]